MERINFSILIVAIFCLSGCATTYQYKGNTFPPLSSELFPSFSPTNEIIDGTKFKLALGNYMFKIKMTANVQVFKAKEGEKEIPGFSIMIGVDIDSKFDISYKKNQFYNKNETIMDIYFSSNYPLPTGLHNIEKQKMKFESIHESSGKAIKADSWMNDKYEHIDFNEKNLKKEIKDSYELPFNNWGKIVKNGDVLSYFSAKELSNMENIFGRKFQVKMSEIIKGWGVYENKKVIVSEYFLDEYFRDPNTPKGILEVRGKGYNLYDAETFILLNGKGIFYINYFSPKEGTISGQIDLEINAYDIQVKEILDAPFFGKVDSNEKPPIKADWSEAKEKMKALGELLEKKLITQEEYDEKKKKLLEQF
jgi:hypothetical protein